MGTAAFSIDTAADGGLLRVRVHGRVTLADGGAFWTDLRRELAAPAERVEVDVGDLGLLDGSGAALLLAAAAEARGTGRAVAIVGADGEVARLLRLYECPDQDRCGEPPPGRAGLLAEIGDAAVDVVRQLRDILAFTADLVMGLLAAARRPRSVQWASVPQLMERAGADGLPIVAVIHFLVGAILGLQGAIQLHRFAADPFLANLVGLSVVRELGPLMTAIVVAGRSGASYAAELGTMTVGEEVDALRTLGQDPQRFLVFPRVLALFVTVPLLTAFADVVACLGGMFVGMVELGMPPVSYLRQLQQALELTDVLTGLIKSAFFAALIGLVACQRGLQTRGGAQGVGDSTTSAVVVVLFGLVALDALFTLVFRLLGW
ncbi:MAG: MlaE family lipid ABC transporter permease subunit [Planctomycetota bacterium]